MTAEAKASVEALKAVITLDNSFKPLIACVVPFSTNKDASNLYESNVLNALEMQL